MMAGKIDGEWHQRRIMRSKSWIDQAKAQENVDLAFICWWVAFNALYGYEDLDSDSRSDRSFRVEFFEAICDHDKEKRQIYDAVWEKFSGPIRNLMSNEYAYKPYWEYRNGEIGLKDYKTRKSNDDRSFAKQLKRQDTASMLKQLFDRLYVLRNQIMHGNATWNSVRNRTSMVPGLNIMSFLVPIFFEIIKNNPEINPRKPYYFVGDEENR